MKFIGNYQSIIPDGLIEFLLKNKGQPRPETIDRNNLSEYEVSLYDGYDMSATEWHIFESKDLVDKLHPRINLITSTQNRIHWWITKMQEGETMALHIDPPTIDATCKRFWVPLQDYQMGHIFIIGGDLIKDYKAGDVFIFDNADDLHGAANITDTPRFALQIIEYL
jgi:hypothetical protein